MDKSGNIGFGSGQLWLERIAEPEQPEWVNWRELLLHFDGEDGQKTIIDNGTNGISAIANNCEIGTSIKKFGTGSLSNDGAGFVYYDDPSLIIGDQPFSVEFWVRFDSSAPRNINQWIYWNYSEIDGQTDPHRYSYLYTAKKLTDDNKLILTWYFAGSAQTIIYDFNFDQWYFVQLSAYNENGSGNMVMAVDGEITNQAVLNDPYLFNSAEWRVGGSDNLDQSAHHCLIGNLDDFRLTIGYNQIIQLPTAPLS